MHSMFNTQKANRRRKALGIAFQRSRSNFHEFLWNFCEKFLVWSSKFSFHVCSVHSCLVRRSTMFTRVMAFILRCEGIFGQKDKFLLQREVLFVFPFKISCHVEFWSRSGRQCQLGWQTMCENKTMLPILMQTSKPNCTSFKFLTFEAKKEAWTFLMAGFEELVARFWSLVLRVLKQQGRKVYGIKSSSTGWSKCQTFWRLGILQNFRSC